MSKVKFLVIALIASVLLPLSSFAFHEIDVVTFTPATDGGKFLSIHQSKTLKQFGFNVGLTTDYANRPFEVQFVGSGIRVGGIIDDLLVMQAHGAFGVTDWLSFGANVPVAAWMTQYVGAGATKTKYYFKLGDVRFDAKFRILDRDRYHVGLAIVPFIYFPTGKEFNYMGNGMWSPGASLVFDVDIANRVFLGTNVTYRNYRRTQWDPGNVNAVLDDTLNIGGAANIRITDDWAVIGEMWAESVLKSFFKRKIQTESEFLAGVKFTPQKFAKGLGITLAGGRGITNAPGSPNYRALLGINYRYEKLPGPPKPLEVEAKVEEKIVITQKIHFEFNRSIIQPVSFPILNDVAKILKENEQIHLVRIEGHTDWIGSNEYNQRLSDSRAKAVREYLIKQGIAAERVEAYGFGESKPIADNNTTLGRAKNRRVEFTVIK